MSWPLHGLPAESGGRSRLSSDCRKPRSPGLFDFSPCKVIVLITPSLLSFHQVNQDSSQMQQVLQGVRLWAQSAVGREGTALVMIVPS